MATGEDESSISFEHTPTWVVAVVCFVIVFISLGAERGLHKLGKCFKRNDQDALFEALQKVKGELMLLGFISLLLTAFQGAIGKICISHELASVMLPCKKETSSNSHYSYHLHISTNIRRTLLAEDTISEEYCARKGKVPFLSIEAVHQLHIFIFVMAIVHVVYCAITMLLGLAKISEWSHWEHSIRKDSLKVPHKAASIHNVHLEEFKGRAGRYWRKKTLISFIVAFFKQFYGSVSKSDYVALRAGFIRAHVPTRPDFDFHRYMLRTLEYDFKKVVGISWYLWLFVVFFLLMNVKGWHTYFWISFLPLVMLVLVGAKLEHIITVLAKDAANTEHGDPGNAPIRPSDELFWFHRPSIVLRLIHFILFQNAFEIAFFFWIWVTYGFRSCMMDELGFIIPRLVIGLIVQVLCSYSTLPLYALVTQMGGMFKKGLFSDQVQADLKNWARKTSESSDQLVKQSTPTFSGQLLGTIAQSEASVVELSNLDKCSPSYS
ncbi:hypothetical protein Leryth_011603 [Lithospermum erythrorhizon]|nr:hypothetical protein Leryth_011603 [Lithospermum erythrorhizon]